MLFEIETDEQKRQALAKLKTSYRAGSWRIRREVLAQITERFPEVTLDLLARIKEGR